MFVSHNKRIVFALIAAAFAGGLGQPVALSQTSGSSSLSKPKQLKPFEPARNRSAKNTQSGVTYRGLAAGKPPAGIQINRLSAVNADAAGVLSESEGGFGANLWKGSQLSFIKLLLAEHPERVRSHVMRRLMRRVLLSASTPPKGAEGSVFTTVRLKALMAMGEYSAGLALLRAIPRKSRESALRAAEVELRLVTGNVVEACGTVGVEVTRRQEAFWQKAFIYCHILAGEKSKAELGLTLLQETETADSTFVTLAEGMINGKPKLPEVITDISLLHLAMLRTANLTLPLPTARKYPAALMTIVKSPAAAKRLDALEIAAEEGLLTGVNLHERYLTALAGLEPAADANAGEKELDSLDRAWLYGEAFRAKIPVAKAEALGLVMASARKAERLGGVARLFAPVVNALTPENNLLWVAPAAFRMQVLTGQQKRAANWFALARRNAAISSDASVIYREMLPLGAMLNLGRKAESKPPPLDDLSADQQILYLSLFHQLGGEVPLGLLENLIYRSKRATPFPDPALWLRLMQLSDLRVSPRAGPDSKSRSVHRAANHGGITSGRFVQPTAMAQALASPSGEESPIELPRLGERILLMLVIMGDQPLDDLNPIIISGIVHGLKQAGLVAEAQDLALEVAVNAGL